jgi:hypothetical protein
MHYSLGQRLLKPWFSNFCAPLVYFLHGDVLLLLLFLPLLLFLILFLLLLLLSLLLFLLLRLVLLLLPFFSYFCPAQAMASCGSAAQRRLWPPVDLQPSAGYGLLWLCSPAQAMFHEVS